MQSLLSILSDTKPYSLQKLSALLHLTNDELIQKCDELREIGINIQQERDLVWLVPLLPLLDLSQLQQALPYNIFLQPVIDSTNQYLLAHLADLNKGDMCLAEYQTAGRGRRGRQWLSPFAGQILWSFYWSLDSRTKLDGFSLVIGLSLVEALKQAGIRGNLAVKWPNDILLNGKKLVGILVEVGHLSNGVLNLVIGIGINIALPTNTRFSKDWVALSKDNLDIDRSALLIQLVSHLYARLERFEQVGIDDEFRQKWQENDAFFGQQVNVISEKEIISGVAQGIDKRGYLQLMTTSEMRYFNAGEVSLRRKCG